MFSKNRFYASAKKLMKTFILNYWKNFEFEMDDSELDLQNLSMQAQINATLIFYVMLQ